MWKEGKGIYVEGVEADMLAVMLQVVFPRPCGRPTGCLGDRGPGSVSVQEFENIKSLGTIPKLIQVSISNPPPPTPLSQK